MGEASAHGRCVRLLPAAAAARSATWDRWREPVCLNSIVEGVNHHVCDKRRCDETRNTVELDRCPIGLLNAMPMATNAK